MGKFDGILLCTDIDDTLYTTEKTVSRQNFEAIEYFKQNGGTFVFATGRPPVATKGILREVEPNAPFICFNGGGIYDHKAKKLLWYEVFQDSIRGILEFIQTIVPNVACEIVTPNNLYFFRNNRITRWCAQIENTSPIPITLDELPKDIIKCVIMSEADEIQKLRKAIDSSEFFEKYNFCQSCDVFYEFLPPTVSKGDGVLRLADILGIDKKKTIGVGDHENDFELIRKTGVGVAVQNAIPELLSIADYITVDNNSHAIAAIIADIENGKIKF